MNEEGFTMIGVVIGFLIGGLAMGLISAYNDQPDKAFKADCENRRGVLMREYNKSYQCVVKP